MPSKRKRLVIAISAVVIAIIVIVPSVYVFYAKSKPVQISVKEGSNSYTWMNDFFSTSSGNPVTFHQYKSTTTIMEKSGMKSTLSVSMDGGVYGFGPNSGAIGSNLLLYVSGNLADNLKPSGLTISVNPVAGSASPFSSGFSVSQLDHNAFVSHQPDNVSKNSGYTNMNLKLMNDTGLKSSQVFLFSVEDHIMSLPDFSGLSINTTYGISVTVSLMGLSKPVSTTLYLFFIDIPKG